MSQTVFKIEGMSCIHCKMKVEKALKGVSGVISVQVELAGKKGIVEGFPEEQTMVKAVEDTGFEVIY